MLDDFDDPRLQALMTNLAGHDMVSILEAFHGVTDDSPTCFIAYTVKGIGLPFAGHKDNHAGLMNPEQMEEFRQSMAIPAGDEWDRFAGLELGPGLLQPFLDDVAFAQSYPRRYETPVIEVPPSLEFESRGLTSTQEGFGRVLNGIARGDSDLAERIVTASPDVTVSTNLGPWVNRRGIYFHEALADAFAEEKVVSAQKWSASPSGQHIELGIAEHNLFLLCAALGLAGPLFGARLLPVATLYDPFIRRGLDAMHYACYSDARFMLVVPPSGITLAPEGGAHQSSMTTLIGIGQPGLAAFEPAYVDALAVLMRWGFSYMQEDDGGSVYLRLTTRPVEQPQRVWDAGLEREVIAGGYWLKPPETGAELAIVYVGAVAPEATEAHAQLLEDVPGAGLLAVTSADRLHADWRETKRERAAGRRSAVSHIERLLAPMAPGAALITVIDAHPATLSWLGSVVGHRVYPLGVERFGQTGDIPELYKVHEIDSDAILDAAAQACLG